MSEVVVVDGGARDEYAGPTVLLEGVTVAGVDTSGQGLGSSGRGSVDTQLLSTTVTGRLGQWIEIGGSAQQDQRSDAGLTGMASSGMRDTRGVWLLVEEQP